jgi:hypothetical protein
VLYWDRQELFKKLEADDPATSIYLSKISDTESVIQGNLLQSHKY